MGMFAEQLAQREENVQQKDTLSDAVGLRIRIRKQSASAMCQANSLKNKPGVRIVVCGIGEDNCAYSTTCVLGDANMF